jgi:DNA-binding transcriptional LysR family regulator
MDWLTATKSFCLLVEHSSFTKAGNVAEVSASAMSKRIDWLEKQLGLTLFVRTTRQVNLTEVGAEFLPRAHNLLNQFDSMVTETQQSALHPSGLLKVAATLAVGSSVLMPHIEAFLKLYPAVKIQLDVLPFGGVPDLGHDLVLCRKLEEFNSTAHRGIKLISYKMGLFASPGYLASHKKIAILEDVSEHKMILTNFYRKIGRLEMESGEVCALTHYNFVSDNLEALLYAAVKGMGLFFVSPMYIKNELARGEVVRILPEMQTAEMQLWAFYPNTEFMPIKSRLFLDFLKERL